MEQTFHALTPFHVECQVVHNAAASTTKVSFAADGQVMVTAVCSACQSPVYVLSTFEELAMNAMQLDGLEANFVGEMGHA